MEEQPTPKARGHETSDADVRPILQFLIGLAVLIVLVMGLMAILFNVLESHFGRTGTDLSPLIDTRQVPPGPRLQANPAEEMSRTANWENQRLNSYAWVDEETGVFRIPIDRAMEIIASEGLPVQEDPQTETGAD